MSRPGGCCIPHRLGCCSICWHLCRKAKFLFTEGQSAVTEGLFGQRYSFWQEGLACYHCPRHRHSGASNLDVAADDAKVLQHLLALFEECQVVVAEVQHLQQKQPVSVCWPALAEHGHDGISTHLHLLTGFVFGSASGVFSIYTRSFKNTRTCIQK